MARQAVSSAPRFLYLRMLFALAGGCLCFLVSWFDLIQPLNRVFYDFANEAAPLSVDDDILVVAIDERSLLELGRWPWPRERHVELLRVLRQAQPAGVAIDVIFSEADVEYPQVDLLLGEEISKLGNVILPVFFAQTVRNGELFEATPLAVIGKGAAGMGHVHISIDEDGLSRNVFLWQDMGESQWPHFSLALAQMLGVSAASTLAPSDVGEKVSGVLVRRQQSLIPFMGPAGTVDMVSYVDVMRGKISPHKLRGKIIFIGLTVAGQGDNITTSLGQISGVEINANIFQAIRSNRLAHAVSPDLQRAVSTTISIICIFLVTGFRPGRLLVAVIVSALLMLLFSVFLLEKYQLWLSPAAVILTICIAYPLWNLLRLNVALGFVQAQLKMIESENKLLARTTSWEDIERAATFLESLVPVESWYLHHTAGVAKLDSFHGEWRHESILSRKYFFRNGEARLLQIRWKSPLAAPKEFLDSIFFDPLGIPEAAGPHSKDLQSDLNRLDSAYSEVRHQRELVANTMDQLNAGLVLSDMSGEIVLLNQQAKMLLPWSSTSKSLFELLGQFDMQAEPDIRPLISSLVIDGVAFSYQGSTNEGQRDLLCRGSQIQLDRTMLLFTLVDVTALMASERNRAEALNFLSHDLRAPLTSVLALIEQAKSQNGEQINARLLSDIEGYVLKNLSYAENFIQLSRLNYSGVPSMDDCDAQSLVDSAVAQLFPLAASKKIQLQILNCAEEVWLSCNRGLMERALINLIDNAIKYSPLDTVVTISVSADNSNVVFEVKDQGVGISEADTRDIFELFQQGVNAGAGTGLGLHFVFCVATAHQGSISVRSNEGGGSTFSLRVSQL